MFLGYIPEINACKHNFQLINDYFIFCKFLHELMFDELV